ncbi:hypothetical protein NFH98_20945 [Halomonas sp. H33-56]
MSAQDYTSIARTPLRRLRELPIDKLEAFLARCAPLTRDALGRIFQAQ